MIRGAPTLPLAYGKSFGKPLHWAIRPVTWDYLCRLLARPASSKEGALSYIPGELVAGPGSKCTCSGLHRTKKTVASRWAITLDVDHCVKAGDPTGARLLRKMSGLGVVGMGHTTFSSRPQAVKMRIVIPMNRVVSSLEYGPITRKVMGVLGQPYFDESCDQACRFMYMSSADEDSEFALWRWDGDLLDADLWLDLAGGPDTVVEREVVEVINAGSLNPHQFNQLKGMCTKLAHMAEGNRDSYLLWALKATIDGGMDPEIAGGKLAEAAIYAGLDPDVVWEKVARILG